MNMWRWEYLVLLVRDVRIGHILPPEDTVKVMLSADSEFTEDEIIRPLACVDERWIGQISWGYCLIPGVTK